MSLHSDTLSWFRASQSLLFLLNAACLAETQQIESPYVLPIQIILIMLKINIIRCKISLFMFILNFSLMYEWVTNNWIIYERIDWLVFNTNVKLTVFQYMNGYIVFVFWIYMNGMVFMLK